MRNQKQTNSQSLLQSFSSFFAYQNGNFLKTTMSIASKKSRKDKALGPAANSSLSLYTIHVSEVMKFPGEIRDLNRIKILDRM